MRYDKQNKKMAALEETVEQLRTDNKRLESESNRIKEILESTLHEVRSFSAQLSKFVEKLSRDTESQPALNQNAQSAFFTAGMISSRLAYTDIELNPTALQNQTVIRSGIYKKFDKARRILTEEAREKAVTIRLAGESRIEIDALPVFELLPFVVLENAIKYSPQNQIVEVSFEESLGKQVVTVTSTGPRVLPAELPRLFERGFRGSNVKSKPGQGLGLFLAKQVCDFHSIQIRAEQGRTNLYHFGGVEQSEFRLVINF